MYRYRPPLLKERVSYPLSGTRVNNFSPTARAVLVYLYKMGLMQKFSFSRIYKRRIFCFVYFFFILITFAKHVYKTSVYPTPQIIVFNLYIISFILTVFMLRM